MTLTRWTALLLLLTAAGLERSSSQELSDIQGNATERLLACSQYELPAPFNSKAYDTGFLGPYRSVEVGTVNYTYHRFGPLLEEGLNNTLVLIPGASSTSKAWPADLLRYLAKEREVVTFDLPGAGSADLFPSDQQSLDYIAQSLLGFFTALQIDEPDLLGYDWGGTIALYLGAFYGDSVGNLVVVSGTSGGEGYSPGVYVASGFSLANTSDLLPALFPNTDDGNLGLCQYSAFESIMPGVNITQSGQTNQSAVINNAWANNTLSENLSNISSAVLIVAGELDVIVDFNSSLYLLENINASTLLRGPFDGHGFLFQDTEAVAPVVVDFLDYFDYYDDYYSDGDNSDDDDDGDDSNFGDDDSSNDSSDSDQQTTILRG